MSKEIHLQYDFAGELVDNRTPKQKQVARQANGYQQMEIFRQREIAQFGVRARPQMPAIARNGNPLGMVLEVEDPRTEEEKAADLQREAESRTYRMLRERPDLYVTDSPYPDDLA